MGWGCESRGGCVVGMGRMRDGDVGRGGDGVE